MSFWKKLFGIKEKVQQTPVVEPKTEEPINEQPIEVKEEPIVFELKTEEIVAQEQKQEPIVFESSEEEIVLEEPMQEPIVSEPKEEMVVIEEPMQEPPTEKLEEIVEKEPEIATQEETSSTRYAGKFEVYPEAGLFKFRLKASNGEILAVSSGYTTKTGAISGIDTLKKNVEIGKFEIVTDKNDYSQFQLYTPNGSRLIISGEFYESVKRAESALESLKKFVVTDKMVELDEIPQSEVREELIVVSEVERNSNGKLEILKEDAGFSATLKASNGEVLFSTSNYASKSSLLQGIESIKKAVEGGSFRVQRDKQDRYQFKLYTANNQVILSGETYSSKDSAISVVNSVLRFIFEAKVIEL